MDTLAHLIDTIRSEPNIPRHVALIMDGNGRWARQRGMPRVSGYPVGMESVRAVCDVAARVGIDVVTLFAFSRANWKRPPEQVRALWDLIEHYACTEAEDLVRQRIRVVHLGDLDGMPESTQRAIVDIEQRTAAGNTLTLVLAVNYGARWEITEAVRRLAREVAVGRLLPDAIDESVISSALATNEWPDPDLMIRTSGELRISDFLLWQLAFSELYLTDVLWPDFRGERFCEALIDFQQRERTYGDLPAIER